LGKWGNRIPWLLGIAYWMLLIINGRFHLWDFHVYYHAAEDWLSGGEVYGKSYGLSSGFYKYSLTALIPFVPFTFLPYFWAASVYYFSLLFLIIQFTKRWSKWLKKEESKWTIPAVVLCTLFFFGDHLERELFLGNINFLLLTLLMWFWRQIQFSKWKWAGWILAVVCLIKPHFVIVLPLIVLLKQWTLLKHFGIALLSLFLIPIIFCGPIDFYRLNMAWLATMAEHNAALYQSPNTLYGLFYPWVCHWWPSAQMNYVLLILILVGLSILWLWKKWSMIPSANLSLLFFLIFALVPSLTHTDTEHFLFSLPLFLFILFSFERNEKMRIYLVLLLIAVIPFLFNSPDLIGKKWSLRMDQGGIGWANFILLIIFFVRSVNGIVRNKAYIRLGS
jgi:hypothetical protein